MCIVVRGRRGDAETSVHDWLGLYHAGLAAGFTHGLILDAYIPLPDGRGGVAAKDGALPVAHSAAVKRIVARARRWGPLLHGLRPEALSGAHAYDEDVDVVAFCHGLRRLVLIRNVSATRFIRSHVVLPDGIAGRPVDRVVEVPAEPDAVGGRVVPARRGTIRVPIDLGPGGARLYEAF
jgi:hypothetical protein